MKKMIVIVGIVFSFLFTDSLIVDFKNNDHENEMRFIYISYLEYLDNFRGNNVEMNQAKIDKMLENIAYYKFNTIILHVSPFSDSIYKSKYFPYSYTLTGVEGKNPGFDYLAYFLKKAHQLNLKVHAWINPYRISLKKDITKLSKNNPCYKFLNTEHIGISNNGIYYDPTSELVKELILHQVKEIISYYNVDGIHFDDYFYMDYNIDKYEYNLYVKKGGNLSLNDFRLMHTNDLIKRVGQLIKNYDENIVFSISPDGNINNNYKYHYADVKTWIKEEYIDIIMPQLYYGFENQYLPFTDSFLRWNSLIGDSKVKIMPVLAIYKVGKIDNGSGRGKNEWINNHVIAKQINYLKNSSNYYGYGVFRYNFLLNNRVLEEINIVH